MNYGKEWQAYRRMFSEGFSKRKQPMYVDAKLAGTKQLLENLLRNPEGFEQHLEL